MTDNFTQELLGELTALDKTQLGWLGRKISTQTNILQAAWSGMEHAHIQCGSRQDYF